MPSKFKTVLDNAVKPINFGKVLLLNIRLFVVLCDEMDSEYRHFLFHSELSRGRVLVRLFQLNYEILLFISENNPEFASLVVDGKCSLLIILIFKQFF